MSFVNSVIFDTDASGNATPTFSVGAGSNRVLGLVICHEQNTSSKQIASVTVGGVSATRKGFAVGGASTTWAYVELWYILEANLGSIGSNPTIAVTPAASSTFFMSGTMFTMAGRNQTASGWTEASDTDNSQNVLSTTLTTVNDADIIGGMTYTVTGFSFTTDAPLTEVTSSDRNMASGSAFRSVQFYHTATSTSTAIGGDNADSSATRYQTIYAVGIQPAATGPTITSTSDDTPTNGTTLTVNGSNFGTNTGSAGVTLGGVSVTPTSWTDTAIQIPISLGSRKYGQNYAIVVTNSSGTASSGYNVQIQPATGVNYVNLSGTLAASGDRITATPDLASGDQLEWSNVQGGTISDVTVNADASFTVAVGVTSFDVRVNDGTGWSVAVPQYINQSTDSRLKRDIARPLVSALTRDLAS